MNRYRFDWRWIALVAVIAVLASSQRLPWFVTALILGGGGVYLLRMGWQAWTGRGGAPSRSRVTYWRGQRIDLAPQRRGPAMPRMSDIGPAVVFLLIGGAMVLGAASLVLGRAGF